MFLGLFATTHYAIESDVLFYLRFAPAGLLAARVGGYIVTRQGDPVIIGLARDRLM